MAMRKLPGRTAATVLSGVLLLASAGRALAVEPTTVPVQKQGVEATGPQIRKLAMQSTEQPVRKPASPAADQPGRKPALPTAQPSEQQVRKLMETIGLGRSLSQMNSQIAASMKQSLPCISSTFWQGFVDQDGSKEFVGRLVPIYQKHFTAEEVDGMVTFYGSPLGQKVLTEMPAAMAEAAVAGQQWSHEHGQQMIAKLEQAGTLTTEGRCPATGVVAAASSSALSLATADDADDSEDEAAPASSASHAHGSSRTGHRHGTVKKKVVPKKSTRSSAAKSKMKAKSGSSKSPAAKDSSAKTPVKAKPTPAAPATKASAAAPSGA